MATIPPHLNFNPSDFSQARQGGASAGLQAARLRQSASGDIAQANQASARMAQEAQIANSRIQMAERELSQRQILAEMEAKTRQEIAQHNYLKEQQRIANSRAYQDQQSSLEIMRLKQQKAVSDARARDAALRFAAQQDFASRMSKGESVDKALYANPALVTPSTISTITSATRERPEVLSREDKVKDESLKTDIDEIVRQMRDPMGVMAPKEKDALKQERSRLERERIALAGGRAATSTTTTPTENSKNRVRVKSPSGKVGTIPAAQLQDALKEGYTEVQ